MELVPILDFVGFKKCEITMLNKYNTVYARLNRQDLVVLRQVLLVDHILLTMPKLLHYAYIPKRREIARLD
jgi:hypothetical protein